MTTFGWRTAIPAAVLLLAALLPQGAPTQPDVNALKKGVVRIRNTRQEEVGTGVIVKVKGDGVYIVTASHVVNGDASPEVNLFTRQREPLRATLLNREEDDVKGLALLWLKADEQALAGLTALDLGRSSGLNGGESVQLIGFPEGADSWTVTPGTVARLDGREVVFSGTVATGNSGGPLLFDGRVVGLVTDKGPTFSYAAQAESVAQYIRGVEPELADLSVKPAPTPTPQPVVLADDFCKVLAQVLTASDDGFRSIKGKLRFRSRVDINEYEIYEHTIYLPGAVPGAGLIEPDREASYSFLSDKDKPRMEAEFAKIFSKVRRCLPTWEHKEGNSVYYYRYHKFRDNIGGKVVVIFLSTPDPQGVYYLSIKIHPRGSGEW